jgi:hypothetical protein
MTGYQSKKAAAQAKLTIDRAQIEQWLQSLKDIDALHHSQEPESVDAQKAIAEMGQALAQPAQEPVAWMFQSGDKFGWRDEIQFAKPWANFPGFRNIVALYATPPAAQPAQEPDVVMHCDSHTWTINNPPPKSSGDVNLYYAPAKEK